MSEVRKKAEWLIDYAESNADDAERSRLAAGQAQVYATLAVADEIAALRKTMESIDNTLYRLSAPVESEEK